MSAINYHHRKFRPITTSPKGQTTSDTIFRYYQNGHILWGEYQGGKIIKGQLIGVVEEDGAIEMCYHHVDAQGSMRTGKCRSVPELLDNGKLRLHESWQWTNGDLGKGQTIIEEL